MDSYHLSKAWHLAHSVAIDIHDFAEELPKSDSYGTYVNIRRAAALIPTQIAASIERQHQHEKLHHYKIARESASELHEVLMLAKERQYIEKHVFESLAKRTIAAQLILSKLIRSIDQRSVETA